jgi:flavin-dependent dehydrogenase
MTAPGRVDALVVGAGPAGAVTAAALAQAGLRTFLVGPGGPAVPGHDVLVSAPAIRALASLAGWTDGFLRPVEGLDLRFGPDAGRVLPDVRAGVCDRGELQERLRRMASAAGAGYLDGTVVALDRGPAGCRAAIVTDGGRPATVVARHVVLAAGARGTAGLVPGGAALTAGLACARRFTGARLGSPMILQLAAPTNTAPHRPPSCVWVLPGTAGTVTAGFAALGGDVLADPADPAEPAGPPDPPDPARLLASALAPLLAADERLAPLRPAGPVASGAVPSGFAPERALGEGCLLAGDAAGLVNPFTGEGLSYAVQSGLLAARSILSEPGDPAAAGRTYVRRLGRAFVGHFETGRHAARRYHLAWRVLAATAGSDHPFFAKSRRAVLLPEGLTGLTGPTGGAGRAGAPRLEVRREALTLRPFLAAADEVALTAVRREWPFIASLLATGEGPLPDPLRPAVLFFGALTAAGRVPAAEYAATAAAVDLATLGALAFLGPAPAARRPGRGVDWGTATTVLAGDFLLAQASRLVAQSCPEASWAFSDWLVELTALRAARLVAPASGGHPAGSATDVFASLFEFPARIGGQLGGASADAVRALRDFGHECGRAFLLAEDVLALRGERTRLDTTLESMLAGRVSAVPEHLGEPGQTARPGLSRAEAAVALAVVTAACRRHARRAEHALSAVPDPAAARVLRAFRAAVAGPVADPDSDRPYRSLRKEHVS